MTREGLMLFAFCVVLGGLFMLGGAHMRQARQIPLQQEQSATIPQDSRLFIQTTKEPCVTDEPCL